MFMKNLCTGILRNLPFISTKEVLREEAGLRVDNITVRYNSTNTALRQVKFHAPVSSIIAIVGVNGSGKSTLFKAIMGFTALNSGSISIFGKKITSIFKNNLISYVPQTEEIDWNFPILVEDLVMMGRYGYMNFLRRPKKIDHEITANALTKVGMSELSSKQIRELSGGQRKRALLARALAQNSKVMLLDEPFAGVDVPTETDIISILTEMKNNGRIILVSTHNLGSVPEFCDLVVLLCKGTVVASGQIDHVFTTENLEQAFGGSLRQFEVTNKQNNTQRCSLEILTDDERPLVISGKSIVK